MKQKNTSLLVTTALFIALIILLGLTPLGLIPLGFIYVTILCLPVIIGTIVLGIKQGMLLGLAFGLVSLYTALTKPSALTAPLLSASLPLTIILCIIPRLMVPLVTHFSYRFFANKNKGDKWGIAPAAIAGSLTNTIFYLGFMLLFYVMLGLDAAAVLSLIVGTGVIAGISEATVAAIISVPVTFALHKIIKRKSV